MLVRYLFIDEDIQRPMDDRTLVYFSDNPRHILEAYAESGEGIDRAGGFAAQVLSDLM